MNTKINAKPSVQFWCLSIFLILVFLTGGASRIDVQSLIFLRPLSVLVCAVALTTIRTEHLAKHRVLVITFGLICLLALAHLIPLSPGFWSSLPGRQQLVDVEKLAQIGSNWRPMTITPMNGWHSLASLAAPLAVILLGIQLNGNDLRRILPLLIALILLSGMFGLMQVIGDPNGPLYLYRITNKGSAVGLFSNRNHAATLLSCIFPLIAALLVLNYNSKNNRRIHQIFSLAAVVILVPLLLVTGSRSGMILGGLGLIGGFGIYYFNERVISKKTGGGAKSLLTFSAIGIVILVLTFFAQYLSRAEAIQRFLRLGTEDQTRTDAWKISLDMFWKYFPFGSGAGSFAEAFQIEEPVNFLSATYLNRAHNDWLETIVTFGVPGAAMLLVGVILTIVACVKLWNKRRSPTDANICAQAAVVAVVLIAAASATDYPLRTPIMMCVLSILCLWISEAVGSGKRTSR